MNVRTHPTPLLRNQVIQPPTVITFLHACQSIPFIYDWEVGTTTRVKTRTVLVLEVRLIFLLTILPMTSLIFFFRTP